MNDAARKVTALPTALQRASDYLGPARVTRAEPHEIEVELRQGFRVEAQMALAFPYAPAVGDVLLVIGKGDEHYVIGVIQGAGLSRLTLPGAVELRAEGGPLTLSSDHSVAIRSRAVEVEADKLTTFAGAVVEKLDSVHQRVTGTIDVRAGETHTIVDGDSLLTAKNASIVTEEAMSINGDEIHLG